MTLSALDLAPVPLPYLQLLGPVTVNGAGGPRPSAVGRATELVAFLALHPSPTHEPLDAAMWPHERVTELRRSGPVSTARRWLGEADTGRPHLSYVSEGGYSLYGVGTDWDDFQRLASHPETTTTENLRSALNLVKGSPLSGVNPSRYIWAELDRANMVESIAHAATVLALRARQGGRPRDLAWAAAVGLVADPSDERLWRFAIHAADATGDDERRTQVRARARAVLDGLGDDLDPRTRAALHTR